ncbi:ABC transporter ATP-binding protein [Streptomyces sp. DSM 41982]|uniref:ABC transporter ATP-binding protein n=1 Tax=Streptomyces evansiae TaxID=3075535 RepID=A0ABD5EDS8_9ACTN|nr:ABC transporter ATP-binding protein [Streptomyces sp. DSM 41982]MDT0418742.1 ABC transporter ATP-binding protein [Streptomyces sp. DSM 41982]
MIRLLRHVLGAEGYRPLRRLLAVLLAAAVLQGLAFALLVPVLRALLGGSPDAVWPWLLALAAVTAAFTAAQAAALAGGFTVGGQLSRALHRRLADHTLTLPVGWFSGGRAAELARIAGPGVMQVMNMPAHLLRPLVSAVVTPAVLVAASFCFDVRVGCVLLAFLPVLLAAHRASTAVVARLDRGRDAAGAEAAERVMEYTRNQPVLRAFGRTSEDHGALDEALAAEARADRRLITRGVPGLVAFAFVARAVLATVLVLTVHWTLDGSLDVPTLLALLVLTARLTEGVSAAADLGAGLRVARHSLEHVAALLDEPPFPVPAEPRVPDGYSVRFHDVDFSYASGTDPDDGAAAGTLRGVAFTAPEGSVTALVGPSGAGKTTVARLLARFWDVTGGSVTIGGVDVRDMAPDVLAATVSPVFQDTYLFDGTVEENVLAGKPGAGAEQLRDCARLSGLDRVLTRLPEGWATRVGPEGTALSGGERQRVAIARALLRDAPVLVLDEATASLDQENEAHLVATVRALARHKTVLVIAHRLSTIRDADRILVLERGRIAERGTHEELLAHGGTYAGFWRSRTRAHGWRLTSAKTAGDNDTSPSPPPPAPSRTPDPGAAR